MPTVEVQQFEPVQVPGAGGAVVGVQPAQTSLPAPRLSADIPRLYADMRTSIDMQLDFKRRLKHLPTIAEDPDFLRRSVIVNREKIETEEKKHYRPGGVEHALKKAKEKTGATLVKWIRKRRGKGAVEDQIGKISLDVSEHKLSVADLCRAHGAQYDEKDENKIFGLPSDLARGRLTEIGRNELTPPKKKPLFLRYLAHFASLFQVLLTVSGLISFLSLLLDPTNTENIVLGGLLFVVVFLNANIEFFQTRKGEKILEGFSSLAAKQALVWRDGRLQPLDAAELVVGDIVKIKAGDKIPADLRVLKSNGMKVDNSALTGEAEPQSRVPEITDMNPLETKNLCFFGTMAVEGEGIGIIIRTGDATCLGQLAKLASSAGTPETHLGEELTKFVRTIGGIAIVQAVLFILYGLWTGSSFSQMITFGIGVFVGNVPQGLPSTVVLLLTLCAKRLAQKNVVCKNLLSVETLGCTTMIASDKTGTLTQNRMTVVEAWLDGEIIAIKYDPGFVGALPFSRQFFSSVKASVQHEKIYPATSMDHLLHSCALCSRTFFEDGQDDVPVLKKKAIGDASEIALLKFYASHPDMPNVEDLRRAYPKLFEIPFNSKNKWQLSIHAMPPAEAGSSASGAAQVQGDKILRIKGAPERVIKKCSHILLSSGVQPLTRQWEEKFTASYERLASKGERVLGHAMLVISATRFPDGYAYTEDNIPLDGYVFIGLTGLQDPPKVGVIEAIQKCHEAGIQVAMVTGDHNLTAKAIAKQVGIIQTKDDNLILEDLGRLHEPESVICPAIVVEGSKIDLLDDRDWDAIIKRREIVFARTSPQQKLLIVSKMQERGHVVAVTGDGVNDSPALRKADLGISMGISGSEVSKEAAALILMDDNFASIVNAIEEGRLIFDNLKKSIAYTLTHIIPEVAAFVLFILIGIPLPLTSMLVLFIDLGTELVSALSLAYEKPESDLMKRQPRSREEKLVGYNLLQWSYLSMGILETVGCVFLYCIMFMSFGIPVSILPFATSKHYFTPSAPVLAVGSRIFTASQQVEILQYAQSAFFLSMILLQSANLFNARAKRLGIVAQGVFSNKISLLGILTSYAIAAFLVYTPFCNHILGTRPVPPVYLLNLIPWAAFMIFVDEIRRLCVRGMILPYWQKVAPTEW